MVQGDVNDTMALSCALLLQTWTNIYLSDISSSSKSTNTTFNDRYPNQHNHHLEPTHHDINHTSYIINNSHHYNHINRVQLQPKHQHNGTIKIPLFSMCFRPMCMSREMGERNHPIMLIDNNNNMHGLRIIPLKDNGTIKIPLFSVCFRPMRVSREMGERRQDSLRCKIPRGYCGGAQKSLKSFSDRTRPHF